MKRYTALVALMTLAVSGCTSDGSASGKRGMTNMETGAAVGAVGGGLAGGAVGAYMDSQKRDLDKNLKQEREAGVIKVEKLDSDVVKIIMTGQTAFETDSAVIKPGFQSTMDKLADAVIRYDKTSLMVTGYTDSRGTPLRNQELSQRRAQAVVDYFESKDVNPGRLVAMGKGQTEPIASNNTDADRRANRRVEILVEPVVAQ